MIATTPQFTIAVEDRYSVLLLDGREVTAIHGRASLEELLAQYEEERRRREAEKTGDDDPASREPIYDLTFSQAMAALGEGKTVARERIGGCFSAFRLSPEESNPNRIVTVICDPGESPFDKGWRTVADFTKRDIYSGYRVVLEEPKR